MNLVRFRHLAIPAVLLAAGTALTACSPAGDPSGSTRIFTTVDEGTPITAGAPMNPFNLTNNTFNGYDVEELGWPTNNPANSNQTLPGLAASWSLSPDGRTLTVHLQPRARWSNGQPVTAQDVKTSAAIWFTQDIVQLYNLGAVAVVNSTTVRFTQVPGAHNNQFESGILQDPSFVVPASVYGHLLPPDIWRVIGASLRSGPAAAAATTRLTAIGKQVAEFRPAADVSAGPFVIRRINPGEALLVKNKYFYAASRVRPPEVLMLHYSDNEQIWNYMQAGRLDVTPYTAMPANVLRQVKAAGNTQVNAPSLVAASLAFDQATYPYGLLRVRQALAYVINRDAVQKVGEAISGLASKTTTGVISSALGDYLTPSQAGALNLYPTDTAKAASLLAAARFTKQGGQWHLPGGRPWTITINVPSGFSDWIAAASVIKSELTAFGVPTSVTSAPDYASYLANLYKGDYAVAFWLTALGPGAYSTFNRIYGTYDGYVPNGVTLRHYPTGNATADNFLNGPRAVDVPGLGTVNPGRLTYRLTSVNLNSKAGVRQQNAIMAKLIAATNYSVPVIQLWDYINVQFVNDKRFGDWPVGNDPQLNLSPGVWMTYGYVRSR
jgi:peptide/nickel transport system substrate-binding protein